MYWESIKRWNILQVERKNRNRNRNRKPKYKFITTHAGKKTFIVNGLRLGISTKVIMNWTRHSDYDTMRPYMDIVDELKRSEMNKFNFPKKIVRKLIRNFRNSLIITSLCSRRDSNPHVLSNTTPSRWQVYQFLHVSKTGLQR